MATIDVNPGKPNQEVFAETVESLASADRNVIVVTSDSRGSGKISKIWKSIS